MPLLSRVPLVDGIVIYETALIELMLEKSLLFVGYYPDLLIQLNRVRAKHGVAPMCLSGVRNAALPIAMENQGVHIESTHGPMVMRATPELLDQVLKHLKEVQHRNPTLRLAELGESEPDQSGRH